MPTIPYIGSRQRVTAAKMNDLWSEFDRKMTLTMDGKSWLLWQASGAVDYIKEITGKRFFFTNLTSFGRSVDLGGSNPNYTHSIFTAAVAAATQVAVDHTNKIVTLTPIAGVDLDNSLEAHKRSTLNALGNPEDYWVWWDGAPMPQRYHRYAVAELIFEHSGVTTYTIPKEYDKYQYFRLHNLNAVDITVQIEAKDSTYDNFTVPAWGSLCVQRRPLGHMKAGYNYFWKFAPGDPRSLTVRPFGGNVPAETMRVNNVWNPALLYEVIELFSERGNSGLADQGRTQWVRMIRDPHIVYDIYPLYRSYFGDPSAGATLLGDLLHHQGEIHYCYRNTGGPLQRVMTRWGGYTDLAALTGLGLTVTSTGTALTIQGTVGSEFNDLVTPGSNLLYSSAGAVITAKEITAAVSIAWNQPVAVDASNLEYNEFYLAVTTSSATLSKSYRAWSVDADGNPVLGSSTTVSYTQTSINSLVSDETAILHPHVDTVTDALAFNTFGLMSLNGADQNSSVAALQNRRMVLTQWGPMILWELKYDIAASPSAGNVFGGMLVNPGRPFRKLDGSNRLVEHRYMCWPGYGWPQYPSRDKSAFLNAYNGSHGGFLGPRAERIYNAFASGGKHPNYGQPIYGPAGGDFALQQNDRPKAAVRTLFTPVYTSPAAGHMPVWTGADQLVEYMDTVRTGSAPDYVALRSTMQGSGVTTSWMPRVTMLREHFNSMVAAVNSCVKARPFCWSDLVHYLPATSESGFGTDPGPVYVYDNGNISGVVPPLGTRGILGTTIRPINQYCSFGVGSFLDHLFTALGVTVKTESDLPSGLATYMAAACDVARFRGSDDIVVDSVTALGGGSYQYKEHRHLNTLNQVTSTDGYKIGQHNANLVFDAAPPSWPGTGTPGDDSIVLTDYRWVTISDVKAAAEALGFKFIFEEMAIPLVLEEFTVGAAYTVLSDTSPYYYETETTATPRSTGVYQTRNFGYALFADEFFPFEYDVSRVRFVPKTTGSPQWKRDVQWGQVVADVTPADVDTNWLPQGPDIFFGLGTGGPVVVLQFTDATDEFRAQDYDLRATPFQYPRALVYQISASTAYTIASGVFRVPTKWYYHPTDNFSLVSTDNARARANLGNQIYPFSTTGSYGSETFVAFASGNNMITPSTGAAHEIVVWQDICVSLA